MYFLSGEKVGITSIFRCIYFPLAESSKGHRFLTRKLGKELGAPNDTANISTAQAATPVTPAVKQGALSYEKVGITR